DHRDDGWNEFDVEEIARYICEKISLKEADFLTDKTKDQFRGLFRLIAERIRQQQNLTAHVGLTKYQRSKPR
ncbi:MAG: ATP-dependent endonuclease, partial [Candidatus Nitrosotenuis sp.]